MIPAGSPRRARPVFRILLAASLLAAPWVTLASGAASPAQDPRRSGRDDMSAATRAMQADDGANPGMLAVLAGRATWTMHAGNAQRSCADCHGEPESLRGVATRYPAWDPQTDAPITLEQRINACRVRHQQAAPYPAEHPSLLATASLIGLQSRGMPIQPATDAALTAFRERGRLRYETRIGQLNFACRDCHDRLAGRMLAGNPIPQAHPTGYPIYRLEWQSMGSLHRRLRNCMTGVRAQGYAAGAIELVELELYLMYRARGMPIETPAVRP